jgi:carboxyl-terminal processing protease
MFPKMFRTFANRIPGYSIHWSGVVLTVGALLMTTVGATGSEAIRTARRDDGALYGSPVDSYDQAPPARGFDNSPVNSGDYDLPQQAPIRSRDPSDLPAPEEIPSHHRPHHQRPLRPATRPGHEEDALSPAELTQRKLTTRYGNPAVIRLTHSMSQEQGLKFYLEASNLIDARHLKPSSYDARVKQTANNLLGGLENRTFLQTAGLSDDPARLEMFRNDLLELARGRQITDADDAYQAVQWTMNKAQRDAGIRPSVIAIEFVYGSIDSLDKFSGFVPTLDRRAPSADLEDHIVGVGVEIKSEDGGMLVVNALPGSPAAEAGLKSGDVIEAVNGHDVTGATLESAVDLITGPAGTRVTLNIRRDERTSQLDLVRRRVEVHSVSDVKMLDDTVGYIKLEKFAQNSSDEFDKALWGLYRQGMKSLVIDLRGNPGGLLTTAIELSNKFVPYGTIVSTRGRDASDNMVEQATHDHTWKTPLVVLVDENSASASEIFAAAIQENGRGLVVGRRTYGKGTVQTHFPLRTVAGDLRLTTAQFFSPKGRVMAGAGVEPDVQVNAEPVEHHAAYRHEAYGQDRSYPHERHARSGEFDGGRGYGRGTRSSSERDIATALETAHSRQVFDMANSANQQRARSYPGMSMEN